MQNEKPGPVLALFANAFAICVLALIYLCPPVLFNYVLIAFFAWDWGWTEHAGEWDHMIKLMMLMSCLIFVTGWIIFLSILHQWSCEEKRNGRGEEFSIKEHTND